MLYNIYRLAAIDGIENFFDVSCKQKIAVDKD